MHLEGLALFGEVFLVTKNAYINKMRQPKTIFVLVTKSGIIVAAVGNHFKPYPFLVLTFLV